MNKNEQKAKIAHHMRAILETLGLDLDSPSLTKTPERVAKMYVDEIFQGLDPNTFPEITFHEETIPHELVLVKNIDLVTFCEHHFVPMIGQAHVAFIPKNRLLGFSKIHQIVRHFARRPQLQERLTAQIADSISDLLQTEDVAVITDVKHYCVIARSVGDMASEVETHVLKGAFQKEPSLRSELFSRINLNTNDISA